MQPIELGAIYVTMDLSIQHPPELSLTALDNATFKLMRDDLASSSVVVVAEAFQPTTDQTVNSFKASNVTVDNPKDKAAADGIYDKDRPHDLYHNAENAPGADTDFGSSNFRRPRNGPLTPTTQLSPLYTQDHSLKGIHSYGPNHNSRIYTAPIQGKTRLCSSDCGGFLTKYRDETKILRALWTQINSPQSSSNFRASSNNVVVGGSDMPVQNGAGKIRFSTASSASVAVTVLDASGKQVASALVNTSPGMNTWSWNAQDGSGRTKPDGIYKVVVKGTDAVGAAVNIPFEVIGLASGVSKSASNLSLNIGDLSTDFTNVHAIIN
eukprot:gene9698-9762_t